MFTLSLSPISFLRTPLLSICEGQHLLDSLVLSQHFSVNIILEKIGADYPEFVKKYHAASPRQRQNLNDKLAFFVIRCSGRASSLGTISRNHALLQNCSISIPPINPSEISATTRVWANPTIQGFNATSVQGLFLINSKREEKILSFECLETEKEIIQFITDPTFRTVTTEFRKMVSIVNKMFHLDLEQSIQFLNQLIGTGLFLSSAKIYKSNYRPLSRKFEIQPKAAVAIPHKKLKDGLDLLSQIGFFRSVFRSSAMGYKVLANQVESEFNNSEIPLIDFLRDYRYAIQKVFQPLPEGSRGERLRQILARNIHQEVWHLSDTDIQELKLADLEWKLPETKLGLKSDGYFQYEKLSSNVYLKAVVLRDSAIPLTQSGQVDSQVLNTYRGWLNEKSEQSEIHADLVHFPTQVAGKIFKRPRIYERNIPLWAQPTPQSVFLKDLVIFSTSQRFYLRDKQSGRIVVPHLSVNQSTQDDSQSCFAFLNGFGSQESPEILKWTWSELSELPRLPRVEYETLILAAETWNFSEPCKSLKEFKEAFSKFKKTFKVHDTVTLQTRNGETHLSLNSDFAIGFLWQDYRKEKRLRFRESFVSDDPFHTKKTTSEYFTAFKAKNFSTKPVVSNQKTTERLAQDWLYLQINIGGSADAKYILSHLPKSVSFFYIFFDQPQFHLRLRLRTSGSDLMKKQWFKKLFKNRLWSVHQYRPEGISELTDFKALESYWVKQSQLAVKCKTLKQGVKYLVEIFESVTGHLGWTIDRKIEFCHRFGKRTSTQPNHIYSKIKNDFMFMDQCLQSKSDLYFTELKDLKLKKLNPTAETLKLFLLRSLHLGCNRLGGQFIRSERLFLRVLEKTYRRQKHAVYITGSHL